MSNSNDLSMPDFRLRSFIFCMFISDSVTDVPVHVPLFVASLVSPAGRGTGLGNEGH